MSKEIKAAELLGLPVDERLQLLEAIWDSLATDPASVPVPDWHRAELDRRLANHEADPDGARPWAEVKARLAARKS